MRVTPQLFGVGLDSSFPAALPYKTARLSSLAMKLLEKFAGYGLQATDIKQQLTDPLFNYEMSFSLFGGNAKFSLTSQKVQMALQNARSKADLDIVLDCLTKTHEVVASKKVAFSNLQSSAQVICDAQGDRDKYLQQFNTPDKGIRVHTIVVVGKCDSWKEEIRLHVEPSVVFANGLFLSWQTKYDGLVNRDVLKNMVESFMQFASKMQIEFSEPPKENS